MNLTAPAPALLAAAKLAAATAITRTHIDAIGWVRLTATADRVTFTATDLESWSETHVEATVTEPGDVCVSARELLAVLPKSGNVTIALDGEALVVGSASLRARSLPHFPTIAASTRTHAATVASADLARLLDATKRFASADIGRPNLCGYRLVIDCGEAVMMATNGHTLARAHAAAATEGLIAETLPPKAAKLVRMICGAGNAEIAHAGAYLAVTVGQSTVWTRPIDGVFPSFRGIIPEPGPVCEFDRREMLAAAKSLAKFVPVRKTQPIRFRLMASGIEASGRNDDHMHMAHTVAAATVPFKEFLIDARYLVAVLSTMTAARVTMQSGGPLLPVVFRGADDHSALWIVMPCRP
jgi:DNA polymerase-3 subunit beta